MEVINRVHKDIQKGVRQSIIPYIKIEKRQIYFSAACNLQLGIMGGLYMHFVNDGDKWQFYMNSNEDGFLISQKTGKLSCSVCNSSLVTLFLNRTKCSLGNKFPVEKTEVKIKDAPVYEIMINKIMEQ